jgi:Alpha 1,4-glycosyltransferase conserved region
MSGLEITCLKSFLDHGHRVIVFAYDDTAIDPRFEREDAARIVPRDQVFFYKHEPGRGSVSAFANLFRYKLLEQYGDWWIDTDVLCLRDDWPNANGQVGAAWEDDSLLGNAVLSMTPEMARACAAVCMDLRDDVVWGQTGPSLVTQVFRRQGLIDNAVLAQAFYPVHWRRWLDAFDPEALESTQAACAGAFTEHLWHELVRRSGLSKRWLPPADTCFGRAVRRHGTTSYFDPASEATYAAEIRSLRQSAGCAPPASGEAPRPS